MPVDKTRHAYWYIALAHAEGEVYFSNSVKVFSVRRKSNSLHFTYSCSTLTPVQCDTFHQFVHLLMILIYFYTIINDVASLDTKNKYVHMDAQITDDVSGRNDSRPCLIPVH